jgi:DNA invertase Pin-like site-specific DNA recombinase
LCRPHGRSKPFGGAVLITNSSGNGSPSARLPHTRRGASDDGAQQNDERGRARRRLRSRVNRRAIARRPTRQAQATRRGSIYKEKVSGARSDRKQLARCIGALRPGDTLLVTRIDRLARSTRDLLNVLDNVAKAGASFRSIADAWCDTTTPHGKLLLVVLGGLSEFERSMILARTSEGRARARAAGVVFGRPRVLTPFQADEARRRRDGGEPLSLIAQTYRVSTSTISRL